MKLEAGKRYCMRNGEVTGELKYMPQSPHPFMDDIGAWNSDGTAGEPGEEWPDDLVSEHAEDTAKDLLKTTNVSSKKSYADKRGEWAAMAMQGLLAASSETRTAWSPSVLASSAIEYADALIARLEETEK